MIVGTGIDLVDIRRIETLAARFGERFLARVFTVGEREYAQSKQRSGTQAVMASYAKMFAAKEACAKALRTGFRDGLRLHHIEVVRDHHGAPSLRLHGHGLVLLGNAAAHLSLSDEYPYAIAQVVINVLHA